MTKIFEQSVGERSKWRRQADTIATKLKGEAISTTKNTLKLGIAFDDGVVTFELSREQILNTPTVKLSTAIFYQVANTVDAYRKQAEAGRKKAGDPCTDEACPHFGTQHYHHPDEGASK